MQKTQLLSVLALLLALQGCALFGASSPAEAPDAAQPATATAEASAAPAATPAAHAAVEEVRSLWTGVRCAKPAEADAKLTALLQKNPQDTTALVLRGMARSELGKKEEAFDDVTAAVRAQPSARHYALRGLVLWRGGNEKAAQIDAHYALRKDKKEPVAHLVLGLAARKFGDGTKACEELRLACNGGECVDWKEAQSVGLCK